MQVANHNSLSTGKFRVIATFVEWCKHVKSQATTAYFSQGKLGWVCPYIKHVWGIEGHVTFKAWNVVGTDGTPPQVPPKLCSGRLRGWVGLAARRCEAGGRMLMMMAMLLVEGWRSPVTTAPAVSAVTRGHVAPAQRGDPCAAAWLALYLPVSGLPWGGVWTPCRFSRPSLGKKCVDRSSIR